MPVYAGELFRNSCHRRFNLTAYLQAWAIDIELQLGHGEGLDVSFKRVLKQPITDGRLLSYIYGLYIKWMKNYSEDKFSTPPSAGEPFLTAWTNAAKSLQRQDAKLELWNDLFYSAVLEGCWEDVSQVCRGGAFLNNVYLTVVLIFPGFEPRQERRPQNIQNTRVHESARRPTVV